MTMKLFLVSSLLPCLVLAMVMVMAELKNNEWDIHNEMKMTYCAYKLNILYEVNTIAYYPCSFNLFMWSYMVIGRCCNVRFV